MRTPLAPYHIRFHLSDGSPECEAVVVLNRNSANLTLDAMEAIGNVYDRLTELVCIFAALPLPLGTVMTFA